MSYGANPSVHSRAITAFFDSNVHARDAIESLVASGIPREHITRTDGGTDAETAHDAPRGFWESLKEMFLPDEDRHSYTEGLNRGGTLVSVRADEANYSRVMNILDRDGAVNMNEREDDWEREGWAPWSTHTDQVLAARDASNRDSALLEAVTPAVPVGPAFAADDRRAVPGDAASPGTAKSETQWIGRRDGTVERARVRGYVMDPVETGLGASADAGGQRGARDEASYAAMIGEHMDVISADGQKIGEVDHLDGPDRIKLAKSTSPDGQHHMVPFTWIDHVDRHVHLRLTLAEIKAGQRA